MKILLILLVAVSPAWANIGARSDVDYFTYSINGRAYIFPKDYEAVVQSLDPLFEQSYRRFEKEYNWKLDEATAVVYVSERNQVPNAFAATAPNVTNGFYIGGAPRNNFFAIDDWSRVLVTHESAHLYQLNVKHPPSTWIKSVFGNISYLPIIFIPTFWVHPNNLVPDFFVEGNAVWNESRWGSGGRLRSGEIRAQVFALAKAKKLTNDWMLNPYVEFPYGPGKYHIGGYFYEYLAKTYPSISANLHFNEQAKSYMIPILYNPNFFRLYRVQLHTALQNFARDLEAEAQGQQHADGNEIAFSTFDAEITASEETISFVAHPDYKSRPWLVTFDRKTGSVGKEKIDIPVGPTFKQGDRWFAASSGTIDNQSYRYALFSDSGVDRSTLNRFIFERKFGAELSFFIPRSFAKPMLLKNGKDTAIKTSSARLGPDGKIYHFQQQGSTRSIFIDNQKIYSFEGYYGKAADVTEDGELDFVGSTKYGSSLFSLKNGKVFRRTVSDRIIDARRISSEKALVAEVSEKGYHFKVIDLQRIEELPYFVKDPIEADLPLAASAAPAPSAQTPVIEPYSGIKEMRYSSLSPYYYYSSLFGFYLSLGASFVDPMMTNSLYLEYGRSDRRSQMAVLQYSNTSYLISYALRAYYQDSLDYETFESGNPPVTTINYLGLRSSAEVGLTLSYPLYETRRSLWRLSLDGAWRSPDRTTATSVATTYSYTEAYGLNLLPYRQFYFGLFGENEGSINSGSSKLKAVWDWGDEWVTTWTLTGAAANATQISMYPTIFSLFLQNSISVTSLYNDSVRSVMNSGFRLDKVLNWPLMFYKIPLGVRRWVPFIAAEYNFVKGSLKRGDDNFAEYSGGMSFEFIGNHKFPFSFEAKKSQIPGRILNDFLGLKAAWNF